MTAMQTGEYKKHRTLLFWHHDVNERVALDIQTVAVERVYGLCVEKRPLHLLPDHLQIERVIRQYRVARSCCELLHKVAQRHVTPLSVTRCSLITSPRLERRSIVTTVSACLSVCPRAYLRNYTSNLREIFMHVTYVRVSVLAAIRYVLPVLWMTSYLHIMGHMQGCQCNTGTTGQPA